MNKNQNDWKVELRKATRSSLISITNETDFQLQRISCKLQQGMLRLIPPEIIPPKSSIEFGSESNAFMTGTKGSVIYIVLPPSVAPINVGSIQSLTHLQSLKLWDPLVYIVIEWSTPYWSQHNCNIQVQPQQNSSLLNVRSNLSQREINKQIHSEVLMFIHNNDSNGDIQFKVYKNSLSSSGNSNLNNSNNSIGGGGSSNGSSPSMSPQFTSISKTNSPQINTSSNNINNNNNNSKPIFSIVDNDYTSSQSSSTSSIPVVAGTNSGNSTNISSPSPSPSPSTSSNSSFSSSLPSFFSNNFPLPWSNDGFGVDGSWKANVKRGSRGQFITIRNNTTKHLIRRNQTSLSSGRWCEPPPEGIPPNSVVEFGSVSSGFTTGTDGVVHYHSQGSKSDFRFQFNNPLMGKSSFTYHCPNGFNVEEKYTDGNISSVYFTINEGDSPTAKQQQFDSPLPTPPIKTDPKQVFINDDSVRIFSFNVGSINVKECGKDLINMNNNNGGNSNNKQDQNKEKDNQMLNNSNLINKRIEQISKNLINFSEKYDIILLQEVFLDSSKDILVKNLKIYYPYIIDRCGENSGLFFASRFPPLWNEFRQFNNGIGSDVKYSKGVQGVKLDISTIRENTYLYVFNANLQANPDNSIAWQMVNGDDKQRKAATVRTLQLQSIRDFISTELAMQSSSIANSALLMVGDFNLNAEVEQVISDNEGNSITLSQIIPELAKKINNKEITVTFSYQLLEHLNDLNIPMRYLGILRSQLQNNRMKSLVLTEMITYIIKKDIIEHLTQRHNQHQSNINEDEQIYREVVLDTFNLIFHYTRKDCIQFWRHHLRKRLRSEFSSSLSEIEQQDWVDLRTHVINLQLFTSLKYSLEITFNPKAVFQIMKGSRINTKEIIPIPLIQLEQIEEIILPPLTSYWGSDSNTDINYFTNIDHLKEQQKKQAQQQQQQQQQQAQQQPNNTNIINTIESSQIQQNNNIQIYLKPTDEYSNMLKILGNPVDLFRESNPFSPGYTIHQALNQRVEKSSLKERVDYILNFKLSPNFGDHEGRNQLLKLECTETNIVPMGATPQTRLSNHFALECILHIKKK
ncbi:hypothetical protein RB653_010395 [Dictyostelium firmibasis]|uniref:Endonuclease/exonuclease/phosphatase domain-containing protein n=1 Tax=Dictyostelium firmibasis TaxID=79012 RepID=A0AAN7TLU6_9MYCE